MGNQISASEGVKIDREVGWRLGDELTGEIAFGAGWPFRDAGMRYDLNLWPQSGDATRCL